MDIADLNLSVRAFNAVCRAEIKTVPELYEQYQHEPEKLRLLVGKHHFEEIGEALVKHREEVWQENRKAEQQKPLESGDYLPEYDPDIWGDAVTFDELAQMEEQFVIVNDSWYPDDTLEDEGEGEVMRVLFAEKDAVILDNGEPSREEITRQEMDDSVRCRYCTKVWKVKGSEENCMNEEKTTVIVTDEYTRAVTLTRIIIANAQAAQQSLYEVCKGLKEMRDGKLYKELGYSSFDNYCENEIGIGRFQAYKYAAIAEMENVDSSQHLDKIGVTKLFLLAKLDEPTREAVTESVDVESVTVKELKAQISELTQERDEANAALDKKDKQFRQAIDSKNNELVEVKTGWKRRSDMLLTKIKTLQDELKEAKAEPQEVAVEDTSRVEELQKQLEQAQEELAAANARLAERPMVQEALPVSDTTDAFKAYMSAAADSMRRMLEFVGRRPNDPNRELYLSRIDGVLNLASTELAKLKGVS